MASLTNQISESRRNPISLLHLLHHNFPCIQKAHAAVSRASYHESIQQSAWSIRLQALQQYAMACIVRLNITIY
jgi:hypothetical protein